MFLATSDRKPVFLHAAQNTKMAIFSLISKVFGHVLGKPSYRAPKRALLIRLMQKGRLKSPQKSLLIENQAFGVILAMLAKNAIWSFWPAISEPG